MPLFFIGPLIWIVLLILLIAFIASNIVIVPQARAYVIERLGAYRDHVGHRPACRRCRCHRARGAPASRSRSRSLTFRPSPLSQRTTSPCRSTPSSTSRSPTRSSIPTALSSPMVAIGNAHRHDAPQHHRRPRARPDAHQPRHHQHASMRAILDEATDPWGIKVNRVELKNILPPQRYSELDGKADEGRARPPARRFLPRRGRKAQPAILVAEGEKEAAILTADAEQQAAISKAEAEKEAASLRADGESAGCPRRAEGAGRFASRC